MQFTHSLKAPGFINPRAYKVKNRFHSEEPVSKVLLFQIGQLVPLHLGDNHIDFLTNDVGICVVMKGKEHVGYNVYVGGGMGRSHRNDDTFAALATPIGFVGKDDIFYAVKAIACAQRDYGRRDDRKQSRLKVGRRFNVDPPPSDRHLDEWRLV
jgi:hypothetical protein